MSNDEIAEKLDIIETQLSYLVLLLKENQQQYLKEEIRDIRERYYNSRVGDDE